ncbi:MAG: adenylate kinase [Anaerolineae bacterium]|nr:adenylate kinase [Anaerolineae bacterium]
MSIALIGPPGSGKGTHADHLIETFNLIHIVTGELFRRHVQERSAIGILSKKYMTRGELVPDEVVDAIVEEWLWKADPKKGILFDGFPRTVNQAKFVDELLKEVGRKMHGVIYFNVPDDEVVLRLLGRVVCCTCYAPYHLKFAPPAQEGVCDRCGGELRRRNTDIPELIRVRLRAFRRAAAPLIDYYQATERLIIIDGSRDIETVRKVVTKAVDGLMQQRIRMATAAETAEIQTLKPVFLAPDDTKRVDEGVNVVLVGGPGSGKGTQASQLKHELDVPHISTGDLFRENIKNKTDLGKLAKSYIDRGQLVPDDVTEAMVESRLSQDDAAKGFILDGFPRTLPQAEALTEILAGMGRKLNAVLYLKVSDAEIVNRLSGRMICRECQTPFHKMFNPFTECPNHKCDGEYLYQRDDDKPDTIRARLDTFHRQTAPLINYYQENGVLVEIDGEGDVADVKNRTIAAARDLAAV